MSTNQHEANLKRYLAIALLLVCADSGAIECGPTMHIVTISNMQESLRGIDTILGRHSEALSADSEKLSEEAQRRLNGARSDAELTAIGTLNDENKKLQRDIDYIDNARTTGEHVLRLLDTAWQLALIRNQMVDMRDKQLLGKYLSVRLSGAGEWAERSKARADSILRKISRPGVAVDVAKLRDAIAGVAKDLAICTSPEKKGGK